MAKLEEIQTPIPQAIEAWLTGRAAYGASAATINQYRAAAQRFEEFLAAKQPKVRALDDLTTAILREFGVWLLTAPVVTKVGSRTGKPLRHSSAASYMRAVVNLLNWCAEQGLLNGNNPAAAKRLIAPAPRDPKRAPDHGDVEKLRRAVERPDPEFRGQVHHVPAFVARGRALLWLMFDTGMRVGEIAALDLADYDRERSSLHVRDSKGGHSRWVFLTPETCTAIDLWVIRPREQLLRRRAPKGTDRRYSDMLSDAPGRRYQATIGGPLFVDRRGERVSAHAVRIWLRHLCERAGTPVYRPHDLRRLYITQASAAGMPLPQVMQQVGHASPRTTMGYIVADPELQREAAIQYSPLSRYRQTKR